MHIPQHRSMEPFDHAASCLNSNLKKMQEEKKKDKASMKEKNKGNAICGCGDQKSSMEVDSFYEKLSKLNESSGLSLVFNFREAIFDLYLLYEEVTQRGGFSQVTKDRNWDEVASALNLKCKIAILPNQLHRVYANLLHQYEQTYYYRTPGKALGPGPPGCSRKKRKHCNNTSSFLDAFPKDCDSPAEKRKRMIGSCQESTGPQTPEQKQTMRMQSNELKKDQTMRMQSNDKELKKDPSAPLKSRTSYQMFLKMECDRLRKIHGENSSNLNIRDMAVDAWRQLSESDKQPYVEASKNDKERFKREMAAYKQHNNKQDTIPRSLPYMINFGTSSKTDGDYNVTCEPDSGEFFLPDESLVKSTMQMMKNATPNDPIFHINWDEHATSPDIPTEGYV